MDGVLKLLEQKMTNEEQNNNERRKILVIDDDKMVSQICESFDSNLFDIIGYMTRTFVNKFGSFEEQVFDFETAEEFIKAVPYRAILLDGDLGIKLDVGRDYDGKVVARRIREGFYGDLNQKTPIYSISSTNYAFQGMSGVREIHKPIGERSLEFMLNQLKQDGVIE